LGETRTGQKVNATGSSKVNRKCGGSVHDCPKGNKWQKTKTKRTQGNTSWDLQLECHVVKRLAEKNATTCQLQKRKKREVE